MNSVNCFLILTVCFCLSVVHCRQNDCLNIPKIDLRAKLDPDVFRNVSELISSKGYPVENYNVQTADGYIISVQRIPNGRKQRSHNNKTAKKVVFIQHGLLADSSCFILNSAEKSLANILADAGYDVWLGNSRGNTYARRHTKYSQKDKEFWQFTFDEMAKYDLPAIIDFILNMTGQDQLYYIGHSQGTTIMFAMLVDNPAYNDKIKLAIALAPVTTLGYMTSVLRYIAPFSNDAEFLLKLLGWNELLPDRSLMHYIEEFMCDYTVRDLCNNIVPLIFSIDEAQFNYTRMPVYLSHYPSGTSSLNIIHFGQLINSKKFQKMDYGSQENIKRYGQPTPPVYVVENITAPVALMWGLNDDTADPTDVALLAQKLKNLVFNYVVPYPKWGHMEFPIGIDADKYIYDEILKLLDKY